MDDLDRNNDLSNRAPATGASMDTSATARVADDARHHTSNAGDEVGEAVGGISGVLTGAAIGSLGGPIGTIIGGIAGAVSGWWAGRAISEAASHVTHEDESYYKSHYEGSSARLADRSYDDVQPAYQLGHLAGRNPDYQTRKFDDVEGDLRKGWSDDVSGKHGSWDQVRDYARHAYDRGRTGYGTGTVAGAAAGATGAALGGASHAAHAVGSAAGRAENAMENAWDKTKSGAEHLGHTAANTLDDMKDRVDGNPASRPGLDATDRPSYGAGGSLGSSGTMGTTGTTGSIGAAADRAADNVRSGAEHLGDKVENAWDKTKAGAENLGHKAANALDDTKDRVDGNPASRPGPDATDRPAR